MIFRYIRCPMNNNYETSRNNISVLFLQCANLGVMQSTHVFKYLVIGTPSISPANTKTKVVIITKLLIIFFCLGISIHKYVLYTCKWLCINLFSLCYQLFFFNYVDPERLFKRTQNIRSYFVTQNNRLFLCWPEFFCTASASLHESSNHPILY